MASITTVDDLFALGLPEDAVIGGLTTIPTETLEMQLEASEQLALGYCEGHGYPQPMTTLGLDLKSAICRHAAWNILVHTRGVDPSEPGHAALYQSHLAAVTWLEKVASGEVKLQGVTPNKIRSGVASVFYAEDDSDSCPRNW